MECLLLLILFRDEQAVSLERETTDLDRHSKGANAMPPTPHLRARQVSARKTIRQGVLFCRASNHRPVVPKKLSQNVSGCDTPETHRLLWIADSQLAQAAIEGGTTDAEQSGRAGPVALGLLEHRPDQVLFFQTSRIEI